MERTDDPTQGWDDLSDEEIVRQVRELRDKVEAIPSEVMEDLMADMDIGIYSKRGQLIGEKSFLIPGAKRDNKPYPFMFLSRLRNSTDNMFLKIVDRPVSNPRYEVRITRPELLAMVSMEPTDGVTIQCHQILTRYDKSDEYNEIDLEELDRDFLAINYKLYTAILDCYEDNVNNFLDLQIGMQLENDDDDDEEE